MPYPRGRPDVPTGECLFLKLPDEVLCRILEYLAPAQSSNGGCEYGPCLPIPLVCRRWKHLYYPFLYRNIDLGENLHRFRQLDATLRQRPDLGDAVRRVGLVLGDPNNATCEMIAYILSCCKGLRTFALHTNWTQSTWLILNAAKRAPLLTLEFSGWIGGPSLQMILKHFSLPTLKKVSLSHYGLGNGEEPGAPWYPSSDTAYEDLKLLLPSAAPCNVTTMVLANPIAPAHVARSFLQWPARLTSLTLKFLRNSACEEDYTVDNVQGILDDHHHTLQHIRLGRLAHGSTSLPDFSSFTSLVSLQIHGEDFFGVSPCSAASRLEAPLLRYLVISFDKEDEPYTYEENFGRDKPGWLEDFLVHMTPGTNRLETVFVEFEPEVGDLSIIDFSNEGTWPWSYIDQAVGIFAAHNIIMTYSQPTIPRRVWEQGVEQEKKKLRREPS